ncbi:hypothetical protein [uncultured Helicobacter sp.]
MLRFFEIADSVAILDLESMFLNLDSEAPLDSALEQVVPLHSF